MPLARRVTGARVGILGMGRIGRAVAHRLEAFGAEISYHSRTPISDVPHRFASSPSDLAAGCDVLVVAAAGGPGSAGLVDAEVLETLGPAGFLINVARGSVVLLPHLASGTVETRAAMVDLVLDNVGEFLARGQLVTAV